MSYSEMCEAQHIELEELKVKHEELQDKLKRIETLALDRFCDWDMARCKIDFIINGEDK